MRVLLNRVSSLFYCQLNKREEVGHQSFFVASLYAFHSHVIPVRKQGILIVLAPYSPLVIALSTYCELGFHNGVLTEPGFFN